MRIRTSQSSDDGVVAWASCVIADAVVLESIAVYRGRDGRVNVRFPLRRTNAGFEYFVHRPANAAAREAIEDAVLSKLREVGAAANAG